MSNSMLKECSGQTLANTALMNAASNHSLEMFIEGVNDNTCLSRFINKRRVKINVAGSKNHAIQALRIYLSSKKTNKKYAVSITDADHDHILKMNHGLNELFLTDDHDLLIQAINSNITLGAIISHERHILREDIASFRQKIFKKCETLGYLRLINAEEGLNINFKKNTPTLLTLTDKKLIAQIAVQDPDLRINKKYLTEKLKNKKAKPLSLNQLCQGHDVSLSLAKLFKKSGKNNIGGEEIEKLLMLSYDFRCFKKTSLHKNLKKWGKKNSIEIFET
jgi:hypothetical protein